MTVRINPENGENIYEQATLIGSNGGQPILRFSYGIDTNFDGRVVFSKIPAGMSNKPTLMAKLNVQNGGNKNLHIAYLTDGISWKTDYVANVRSKDSLDLTGWVTINNESGIDYNQAKIQLIAGDVNIVRPMMARSFNMAKGMVAMAAYDTNEAVNIEPESISFKSAKGCKAVLNSVNKNEIDITELSAKSGSAKFEVVYPGGVTKIFTVKVKRGK
jgi:hypothetical protein